MGAGFGLEHALGHLAEHLMIIDFLERFAALAAGGHVADEQHQRRGILAGGVNADRGIGCARSAADEACGRAAGQLAIGFGGKSHAAFMAGGNQFDGVARILDRPQDRQVALARYGKSCIDAIVDQSLHNSLAAIHGIVPRSLRFWFITRGYTG